MPWATVIVAVIVPRLLVTSWRMSTMALAFFNC
jgi:hypothetical protein